MCSICGFTSSQDLPEYNTYFKKVLLLAQDRGRDSFGVCGPDFTYKRPHRPELDGLHFDTGKMVIANCRAEPTTEYVISKGEADIQPFNFGNIIVSHNGTIANDAQLRHDHNLQTDTDIDSAVIPLLVHMLGVPQAVRLLVGSFALSIIYEGELWLACNYKPIFLKKLPGAIFFSSMEHHLRESPWDRIWQIPPYSIGKLTPDEFEPVASLYPEQNDKVLVICSGGLDSVVTATHYMRERKDVTLLHFLYGSRPQSQEILAVDSVADFFGIKVKFINVADTFKKDIGHSRLTDTGAALMTDREGEASAELAWEWVPARNLTFYSLALAYAEAHGFDTIALGNNLEESGAYPDNEMIFTQKFREVVPYSVNLGKQISIEMPVGNLMKHEIVKLGIELGAPLHLTWSCYENGPEHCGTCGPCYMRRKAFQMNGIEEVIEYAV